MVAVVAEDSVTAKAAATVEVAAAVVATVEVAAVAATVEVAAVVDTAAVKAADVATRIAVPARITAKSPDQFFKERPGSPRAVSFLGEDARCDQEARPAAFRIPAAL